MFRNPLWKEIKKNPFFKNLPDFYEGIFYSFDEADFDTESNKDELIMKASKYFSYITLKEYETVQLMHLGKAPYKLMSIIEISYDKDNVFEVHVEVNKEVKDDNQVVGKVHIELDFPIKDVNYESGREVGKEFMNIVSIYREGIGKEVFDAFSLCFLSMSEDINIYTINYRILIQDDTLVLSAENEDWIYLSFHTEKDGIPYIQCQSEGIASKEILTPELLNELRNGNLDSFSSIEE